MLKAWELFSTYLQYNYSMKHTEVSFTRSFLRQRNLNVSFKPINLSELSQNICGKQKSSPANKNLSCIEMGTYTAYMTKDAAMQQPHWMRGEALLQLHRELQGQLIASYSGHRFHKVVWLKRQFQKPILTVNFGSTFGAI